MDSPSGAGWEGLSREGVGQVSGKGQVMMVRARESGLIMTELMPRPKPTQPICGPRCFKQPIYSHLMVK